MSPPLPAGPVYQLRTWWCTWWLFTYAAARNTTVRISADHKGNKLVELAGGGVPTTDDDQIVKAALEIMNSISRTAVSKARESSQHRGAPPSDRCIRLR